MFEYSPSLSRMKYSAHRCSIFTVNQDTCFPHHIMSTKERLHHISYEDLSIDAIICKGFPNQCVHLGSKSSSQYKSFPKAEPCYKELQRTVFPEILQDVPHQFHKSKIRVIVSSKMSSRALKILQTQDINYTNLIKFLAIVSLLCLLSNVLTTYWRLRDVPGPLWARVTNLQRVFWVKTGRAHVIHREMHDKYGSFVRFGPNTVSVSDPDAITTLYPMRMGFVKVTTRSFFLLFPYSGPREAGMLTKCFFFLGRVL